MRAEWGVGLIALVATGGLLAGIGLGSAPGARPAAVRALGGLPELLRPDLAGLAQPATSGATAPAAPAPFPTAPTLPSAVPGPAPASPAPAPTRAAPASSAPASTGMAPASPAPASTGMGPENPAPAGVSPAPTPADTVPPCTPTARACVDLSANRSWLLQDGRVTHGPVPITHGRTGFRTPPGIFRVTFKNRDHVSSIYDAEMPWSVFFNGGIAFHEGSLSTMSHGCIRLSPAAARTYFDALSVGDVVQVVP